MFQHLPELLIILVLALIVFGPEKLPEVAGNAGRMVRQARAMLDEAMNPVNAEPADDFDTYYYESLARSGEDVPTPDEDIQTAYEPAHSPHYSGDLGGYGSEEPPAWTGASPVEDEPSASVSARQGEEPVGKPL